MKIQNPLQFYVDKLARGERFSLARYGDGELYCMWGKKGGNSNGCRYSPELREALLDSMKHFLDKDFMYGLQRVLPQDEKRIMQEYPHIKWHDTEIFSEAVANGELYPLIAQLKKMDDVLVVGNDSISRKVADLIDWDAYCIVPPSNAYDMRLEIVKYIKMNQPSVVLFSCGMAANAIIGELHGQVESTMIDLGHIWDPFTGNMSRCDLEGKTLEDINKNLHAKNN